MEKGMQKQYFETREMDSRRGYVNKANSDREDAKKMASAEEIASGKVSLTGDRPTGHLHLGHYVGSLENRLRMQEIVQQQYIIIADLQALTDNHDRADRIKTSAIDLMRDYLSVGLDPMKNVFFLQSKIPALYEMTFYYMNLMTVAQLGANPTVRQEMKDRGFEESVPVGFFCYPISQAADITAFQANLVPVGNDQLPMIETTNRIVERFEACYGPGCIRKTEALLSNVPRLEGIYGKAKASKSSNNAIFLSDTEEEVKKKVGQMYTDPNHLKVTDPGQVEGNVVFSYLAAFWKDTKSLEELQENYRKGGVADRETKRILCEVLSGLMTPIREARARLTEDHLLDVLHEGTERANAAANETLDRIRRAIWKLDGKSLG